MAQTYLRQNTQIRKSTTFDDGLAAGSTLESAAVSLEDDLNALRSQLTRILRADGSPNWYDAAPTVNAKQRGLYDLNFDLDDLEEKKFLFRTQVLTDIAVPAAAMATGTLTLTGNAGDTETVTIGTKTYTFQAVLTNVDGNVLIGGTASDSIDNLIAAINLGAGAGVVYAAATTANTDVSAAAGAGDTMDVTALVNGTRKNLVATTATLVSGSWGSATLTGGAGDIVVLSNAGGETPTLAASVTVAQNGAVVAVLGTDVGTWYDTEVAGSSAISPKNLVLIRNAVGDEPIIDVASGREIHGLLQAESGVVDGDAFDDATKQVQISFVIESDSPHDLIAFDPVDIAGLSITYSYVQRKDFDSLPEDAFLTGIFADQTATTDVTLNNAIDNQTGAATQSQNIDWRIDDTFTLDFQDSTGAANILRIAPNVAGDEVEFNLSVFDVNNTTTADFLNGAAFDTGGTTINVGATAGQIDSAGALTLATAAAGDLKLDSVANLVFDDGFKSGSTFASDLVLSDSSAEWSAFETAFGEVSLLNAIVQANSSAAREKRTAVVTASSIAPDVNVTGAGGTPNIDLQLQDYSGVGSFVEDVDIYLNGVLMRNGTDSLANYDVYPGTTPANGDLKFEFRLHINDTLTMVTHGV